MAVCCSSERNTMRMAVDPLAASKDVSSAWKQLSLTRLFKYVRVMCYMLSVHCSSTKWMPPKQRPSWLVNNSLGSECGLWRWFSKVLKSIKAIAICKGKKQKMSWHGYKK